jgi:hypothetical protein
MSNATHPQIPFNRVKRGTPLARRARCGRITALLILPFVFFSSRAYKFFPYFSAKMEVHIQAFA